MELVLKGISELGRAEEEGSQEGNSLCKGTGHLTQKCTACSRGICGARLGGELVAPALCNECFVLKGRQGRGPALEGLSTRADMDLRTGRLSSDGKHNDGGGTEALGHETESGAKEGSLKCIWAGMQRKNGN